MRNTSKLVHIVFEDHITTYSAYMTEDCAYLQLALFQDAAQGARRDSVEYRTFKGCERSIQTALAQFHKSGGGKVTRGLSLVA